MTNDTETQDIFHLKNKLDNLQTLDGEEFNEQFDSLLESNPELREHIPDVEPDKDGNVELTPELDGVLTKSKFHTSFLNDFIEHMTDGNDFFSLVQEYVQSPGKSVGYLCRISGVSREVISDILKRKSPDEESVQKIIISIIQDESELEEGKKQPVKESKFKQKLREKRKLKEELRKSKMKKDMKKRPWLYPCSVDEVDFT